MMGFGVPRGATMPCHCVTVYPGTPASIMVGISGATLARLLLAIASARNLPERTWL